MKIIELKVSNFLRIEAAEIRPDGNLVVIAGPNEAGKSSVGVKAIWAALGGKDAVPEKPIRDGAERGEIVLTIGNGSGPKLRIKRVFTAGGTRLEVSEIREDGMTPEFRSPQKMLSALIESLAFDPHRFATLDPQTQAELLSQITGLDVSDLDAEYQRVYDARRDLNRDIKAMGKCPMPEGERPTGVDVAALVGRLREGEAHNRTGRVESMRRQKERERIDKQAQDAALLRMRANKLREQAASLDATAETAEADVLRATEALDAMPTLPDPFDPAPIESEIAEAEIRNAAVRDYDAAEEKSAKHRHLVSESAQMDAELASLKMQRAERVAAVKMPLDGLAIADGIVTLDGQPLSQASTARQIEVGARVAAAQNPRLRVMRIEQGSMLDSWMLASIGHLAETLDMQVWVERVADVDDGTGFYIEGGVLAERGADRQETLL